MRQVRFPPFGFEFLEFGLRDLRLTLFLTFFDFLFFVCFCFFFSSHPKVQSGGHLRKGLGLCWLALAGFGVPWHALLCLPCVGIGMSCLACLALCWAALAAAIDAFWLVFGSPGPCHADVITRAGHGLAVCDTRADGRASLGHHGPRL